MRDSHSGNRVRTSGRTDGELLARFTVERALPETAGRGHVAAFQRCQRFLGGFRVRVGRPEPEQLIHEASFGIAQALNGLAHGIEVRRRHQGEWAACGLGSSAEFGQHFDLVQAAVEFARRGVGRQLCQAKGVDAVTIGPQGLQEVLGLASHPELVTGGSGQGPTGCYYPTPRREHKVALSQGANPNSRG